jgi:hypothetical protein
VLVATLGACQLDPPPDDGIALPPNPDAGCDDKAAKPEKLFEEVWSILDATYPYFDYKQIDWQAQHDACLEEVCEPEHEYEDFIGSGMDCLLAPLSDWLVQVFDRDGESHTFGTEYDESNISLPRADGYLDDGTLTVENGTTSGRLADGRFGYLRVESFSSNTLDDDLVDLIAAIGPVEGFVIDVRSANSGASAENAMDVAGFFVTDTTNPYGFDEYREEVDGDPATHELGPPIPKTIEADRVQQEPFTGPVAVLTGEVCWIGCEWFVAMMELAPDVRSFGAATRGRSSDWQGVFLDADDETQLISSTSLTTLPDGTIIEWNGIAPDEPVEFDEGNLEDDVLEAAIAWLEGS